MASKGKFLILLGAFVLTFGLYSVNTVFATDSVNVIENKDGHVLRVPKDVKKDEILSETDKSIRYRLDKVVSATDNKGAEYSAPGIVDTRITREADNLVSGRTDYLVDLRELTVVEKSFSELSKLTGQLFGIQTVYAQNSYNNSSNSTWDDTGSVRLYMTVKWTKYDDGSINITNVSGGYSIAERDVTVIDSNLFVGLGWQTKTFNLGGQGDWSCYPEFSREGNQGWITHKYSKYTVYLDRYGSKWNVVLDNVL